MPTFDALYAYAGKVGEIIYIQLGNIGSAIGDALIEIGKVLMG